MCVCWGGGEARGGSCSTGRTDRQARAEPQDSRRHVSADQEKTHAQPARKVCCKTQSNRVCVCVPCVWLCLCVRAGMLLAGMTPVLGQTATGVGAAATVGGTGRLGDTGEAPLAVAAVAVAASAVAVAAAAAAAPQQWHRRHRSSGSRCGSSSGRGSGEVAGSGVLCCCLTCGPANKSADSQIPPPKHTRCPVMGCCTHRDGRPGGGYGGGGGYERRGGGGGYGGAQHTVLGAPILQHQQQEQQERQRQQQQWVQKQP